MVLVWSRCLFNDAMAKVYNAMSFVLKLIYTTMKSAICSSKFHLANYRTCNSCEDAQTENQIETKSRDSNADMAEQVIFKEFVVIGNGPSAISLSYVLDGHRPYYNGADHPNEMLDARLKFYVDKTKPITDHSLSVLSEGLEGRSRNPVSLLYDTMNRPYVDLGFKCESLVAWKKTGKVIDHIVLGKGPPGGIWHQMDPGILTLSLGSWMELPDFPYIFDGEKRTTASQVAEYYTEYVKRKNLTKNFRNNFIVTSVTTTSAPNCVNTTPNGSTSDCKCYPTLKRPRSHWTCEVNNNKTQKLHDDNTDVCDILKRCDAFERCYNEIDCDCFPNKPTYCCEKYEYVNECDDLCRIRRRRMKLARKRWKIEGFDARTEKMSTYITSNLVLANGSSDRPNRLGVSGECDANNSDWILHNIRDFETKMDEKRTDLPALVIGGGLSAADAIIASINRNRNVIHVFRHKHVAFNKQLSPKMYPEYHQVHTLMSDPERVHPLYKAMPEHKLIKLSKTNVNTVTLQNVNDPSVLIDLNVSFVVILIGSRPDFQFLRGKLDKFNETDEKIEVDPYTYRVMRSKGLSKSDPNLYAMGPLVGDNFVRYLPGAAWAIASTIDEA